MLYLIWYHTKEGLEMSIRPVRSISLTITFNHYHRAIALM